MSEPQHVIPGAELDAHEASRLCICSPIFVEKKTGIAVSVSYWEHFKLAATGDPHRELH